MFKQGGAADAAAFEKVKEQLAMHAGTWFKGKATDMARIAIEDLVPSVLVEPAEPTQPGDVPTVAERVAMKKWEHAIEMYYKDVRSWDEARPKAFQLVLSHVETELGAQGEARIVSRVAAD